VEHHEGDVHGDEQHHVQEQVRPCREPDRVDDPPSGARRSIEQAKQEQRHPHRHGHREGHRSCDGAEVGDARHHHEQARGDERDRGARSTAYEQVETCGCHADGNTRGQPHRER
jgi:hypothetical protein